MCGQRSSIAYARSSSQNTTTGSDPTLVSSCPDLRSSSNDPACTLMLPPHRRRTNNRRDDLRYSARPAGEFVKGILAERDTLRPVTDVRITPARQRVLEILKLEEPATASSLAAELGLTEAAVRQHLGALEADGIVAANATAAERPGRPAARWSLTDVGRRDVPRSPRRAHRATRRRDPRRAGRRRTHPRDRRPDRRAAPDRTGACSTTPARRCKPGSPRSPRSAAPRDTWPRSSKTTTATSWWSTTARSATPRNRASGFCTAELRLFSEALGDDVTVERTEHLLAEGRRCTYRIQPR